jgi:5-methylcytosine-specific restriction endonuclease McrA
MRGVQNFQTEGIYLMDERICLVCSARFTPRRRDSTCCSQRCMKKRSRDSRTLICGEQSCTNYVRAKGLCGYHYRVKFYPNSRLQWPEDPGKRRAALRTKTQLRRARLRDPEAEAIDRDEIGERDDWRCGLCCERIDRLLPWPDPRSASLDHIVPLSCGGPHVRSNVQIAHLDCNQAKGNRSVGEQLLLIG